MEITDESRSALLANIGRHLDTRDKRFMFLKTTYPDLIPRINLEGNQTETSWSIYEEFRKQQMLGSLMAALNHHFGCNLTLVRGEAKHFFCFMCGGRLVEIGLGGLECEDCKTQFIPSVSDGEQTLSTVKEK